MLVQYGGGILDARGSVGGQVHSRNRYGSYVRARTTPVNPNSSRQQSVRSYITAVVSRWREVLSSAQREAWEVYAANIAMVNKLGQTIKLTGFNHYVRSNTARMQMGLTVIDEGPTELSLPPGDVAFGATASELTSELSVTFDDEAAWVDTAGAGMSIKTTLPVGEGRSYLKGPTRYCGAIIGDDMDPETSPVAKFPAFSFAQGQKFSVIGRIATADGRLSSEFSTAVTVGA